MLILQIIPHKIGQKIDFGNKFGQYIEVLGSCQTCHLKSILWLLCFISYLCIQVVMEAISARRVNIRALKTLIAAYYRDTYKILCKIRYVVFKSKLIVSIYSYDLSCHFLFLFYVIEQGAKVHFNARLCIIYF